MFALYTWHQNQGPSVFAFMMCVGDTTSSLRESELHWLFETGLGASQESLLGCLGRERDEGREGIDVFEDIFLVLKWDPDSDTRSLWLHSALGYSACLPACKSLSPFPTHTHTLGLSTHSRSQQILCGSPAGIVSSSPRGGLDTLLHENLWALLFKRTAFQTHCFFTTQGDTEVHLWPLAITQQYSSGLRMALCVSLCGGCQKMGWVSLK